MCWEFFQCWEHSGRQDTCCSCPHRASILVTLPGCSVEERLLWGGLKAFALPVFSK